MLTLDPFLLDLELKTRILCMSLLCGYHIPFRASLVVVVYFVFVFELLGRSGLVWNPDAYPRTRLMFRTQEDTENFCPSCTWLSQGHSSPFLSLPTLFLISYWQMSCSIVPPTQGVTRGTPIVSFENTPMEMTKSLIKSSAGCIYFQV